MQAIKHIRRSLEANDTDAAIAAVRQREDEFDLAAANELVDVVSHYVLSRRKLICGFIRTADHSDKRYLPELMRRQRELNEAKIFLEFCTLIADELMQQTIDEFDQSTLLSG